MGVKRTTCLTRQQAEEKFVELHLQDGELQRRLRANAVLLDDEDLENILEVMNDKVHDGEGFCNYMIVTDHDAIHY